MDITKYLINCIKENIPITFAKFGDGEYTCIFNPHGKNCDNDMYTYKLSSALKASFKYLVDNTNNTYIGI
jgi:hypothetical protein